MNTAVQEAGSTYFLCTRRCCGEKNTRRPLRLTLTPTHALSASPWLVLAVVCICRLAIIGKSFFISNHTLITSHRWQPICSDARCNQGCESRHYYGAMDLTMAATVVNLIIAALTMHWCYGSWWHTVLAWLQLSEAHTTNATVARAAAVVTSLLYWLRLWTAPLQLQLQQMFDDAVAVDVHCCRCYSCSMIILAENSHSNVLPPRTFTCWQEQPRMFTHHTI